MTAQEIFDRIAEHLLTQKTHAYGNGGCVYLAENGNRCAIGALIPDNHDGLYFTGTVFGLLFAYPDLNKLLGHNMDLLCDLQQLHDRCRSSDWLLESVKIAKKHNLNADILDKFIEEKEIKNEKAEQLDTITRETIKEPELITV